MTFKTLEKNLESPEFFKKAIPSFLFFNPWKKELQKYQEAELKRVVPNYLLRKDEHDEFFYNTYAFSVNGAIDENSVENLIAMAHDLELGQVRYIAHGTNGFFPLIDENGKFADHTGIATNVEGLYLFTVSDDKENNINCPCSVVISKGKEMWKWPVKDKFAY